VRNILESEEYGKYIPTIEAAVRKFKDENLKNQIVACIYLTGGASRMDFVREIFMKVFNLKEGQCPSDDNPSLIVSQGVAHLSYADYRTAEKEKELRTRAMSIINSFDWEGKIKHIVLANVKQSIIDKAKDIMLSYKNGKIYDMHTVKNGDENGVHYGYGLAAYKEKDEGYWSDNDVKNDGYLKYRNMEALIKRIKH
jgi:molecular chaperone DnaK (HSP70)